MAPIRQAGLNPNYAAIGVNVSVPLTNGNLFAARHTEASLRASAEGERLRDLENRVARDVRLALLDAQSAFQRLDLTNQLLEQASQAQELAEARYNLGLSSIVELTQAQLNKTRAELEQASARYDYQARMAALRYQTGSSQIACGAATKKKPRRARDRREDVVSAISACSAVFSGRCVSCRRESRGSWRRRP